jgi:thermostable 8-oxoguanine DNA glycosylase
MLTIQPDVLKRVENIINAVEPSRVKKYKEYWETLKPRNHDEYWRMWLFAFTSVHTTWRENVRLAQSLFKLPKFFTRKQLRRKLREQRFGILNVRTKGIWQFYLDYWTNPKAWYRQDGETMVECRDRMMKKIFGLGITKTSFVLEMAYPDTCDVVCVDTHIKQLYGFGTQQSISDKIYREIEKHWTDCCKARKLPSPLVRHIYWDSIRGQPDTRYWSFCLERKDEPTAGNSTH